MTRPTRIPLFPLDLVLFPGMTLPLHIFEPRYKLMVARCLEENLEFGMILAEGKTASKTGCTAEIVRKIKDYPDGRMDIITEGRAIFRLAKVLEEREYYEAIVEYPHDEFSTQDPRVESRLRDLFQQYRTLLTSEPWVAPDRNPKSDGASRSLAYSMAEALPLELRERQELLEMRVEDVRRAYLARWLGESLPRLVERQQLRRTSGGNGHRPN
jgi:ATP-dependent Lon protease